MKQQESRRLDLKHLLFRPPEHLQEYPLALEAIMKEITAGNLDEYYLTEVIQTVKDPYNIAQLRTFHTAMGKGPTSKWEWQTWFPGKYEQVWGQTSGVSNQLIH